MLPFDKTQFEGFQRWRSDMETMAELRNRAATFCPDKAAIEVVNRGSGSATGALADAALDLTPAGAALGMAQTVLGLLSTEASTTSVAGTIEDQAFMNGVARQLRTLSVSVLMPGTYDPFALTGVNETGSPFLTSLDKLFAARSCLGTLPAKPGSDAIIRDTDAYLATLSGTAATASTTGTTGAKSGVAAQGATASNVNTGDSSHLMTVLRADGFARKLGIDPETAKLPNNAPWQHLLMIKALESGGSVEKDTSILGSKIRYSGGSVGTYALFTLDGELECSGNVYDYGGSVRAKKFEKDLRRYRPDPASQFLFQRGSCQAPAKR